MTGLQCVDSSGRFDALVRCLPVQVWRASPNGSLIWFNDEVYAYTGCAHDKLTGSSWLEIVHPDDSQAIVEALGRATLVIEQHQYRLRIRGGDGIYRWFLSQVKPLCDAENNILSWIGTNTNVDAVRQFDMSLEGKGKVVSDDKAYHEDALMASKLALLHLQKMEALGQLTGGLAHDFNNLLSPIVGALDMVRGKIIDDLELVAVIDCALKAADIASANVRQLLTFARQQPIELRSVDLGGLVYGLKGLIEDTIKPHVILTVDVSPNLSLIWADKNQLETAILNLCANARDAMPKGGHLHIQLHTYTASVSDPNDLASGDYILMAVRDTGEGMSEDVSRKATEPFFSTKATGKGTGLGLSMVAGLIAQLNGKIIIDSLPDKGSTINVWLPVAAKKNSGQSAIAFAAGAR